MIRWASLPMYDFPELRAANVRLWTALARLMREEGIDDVPESLSNGRMPRANAPNYDLLFTLVWGFPLRTRYGGRLTFLGVPCYYLRGCAGRSHREYIVLQYASTVRGIEDLRVIVFAVNESDSNTGMNLARRLFAPIARSQRFFSRVTLTGSHIESMKAVAAGDAAAASVDCVTFAFCERFQPELHRRLRVLDVTPQSPSLPFVTAIEGDPDRLTRVRRALGRVRNDRETLEALKALSIVSVADLPDAVYDVNLSYAFEARKLGYHRLR